MDLRDFENRLNEICQDDEKIRLEKVGLAIELANSIGEFKRENLSRFKTEYGYFKGIFLDEENVWIAFVLDNRERMTNLSFENMTSTELSSLISFLKEEYDKKNSKKYIVECSVSYHGIIEVNASSETEAINKAEMMLNTDTLKNFPNYVQVKDTQFLFADASGYNAYLANKNE